MRSIEKESGDSGEISGVGDSINEAKSGEL
jgi:hypothetical protein